MWGSLIAIIATVLDILKEYLQWQVALTKIQARKLAYDIDQQQLKSGRELTAHIDAARTAGDLAATELLLSDASDAALFAANIRSAIPDGQQGTSLGIGSDVPGTPAQSDKPDDSVKPVESGKTDSAVVLVPDIPAAILPLIPSHTIPKVPYAVTGDSTWFGLNPDGSNDTGDVGSDGKNLLGAFGDDNHNEQIIGGSIPIKVFNDTVGSGSVVYKSVASRSYTLDVLSHTTGKHLTGVWLTDLGPNAKLHRPLDLTYAANKMLGHDSGTNICTWWLRGPNGIMEVKGWDFINGMVSTLTVEPGKVDARSESIIATLSEPLKPLARKLVLESEKQGITIKVIDGLRTYVQQDALYAQGRTNPGPVVTNAKGGYSNHNFGLAMDIGVFVAGDYVPESPAYKIVGKIGQTLGLNWGGSWKTIQDEPHFELRPQWALNMSEPDMVAELRKRMTSGKDLLA